MAVKVPTIYKDMYMGNKTEQQAELILHTRDMKEVPSLKNMLFNFSMDLIEESLDRGVSIRELIDTEHIDYTNYIGQLRDYQTVGTAFMYLSPRSVIADSCGLGKTAEIAALLNYLYAKHEMRRFVMAVDTTAVAQTVYELMKFTGMKVIALPGEAYKIKKVIEKTDWSKINGIVVKHSTLRSDAFYRWLALNANPDGTNRVFDVFILDESSLIKNPETRVFEYTKNLCNIASRVYMMNATTFESHILDIYNQMDSLDPNLLPSKSAIEKEFCTFGKKSYWIKKDGKAVMKWARDLSGYKNQEIFKERLKLSYFGRSKADVGLELPHIYKTYEIIPTNDQLLAINKGYRYNEVLNCPSLISELNIPTDRKNVPKLDRLCDIIETEFSESSVMVYCFHIEAQHAIEIELRKIGRKPVILNGACTDEQRFQIQNDFNSGRYDVLITNIKRSLNLQRGSACIFYSMETNIAKMEQIKGRIDRSVDDEIKTFILLLYSATPEYNFFKNVVCQRSQDSRDLTIDAKTAADWFRETL